MGRDTRLFSMLAAAALTLAACGGGPAANPTASTGEPIVIGTAISLTGSQAKEGILAKQGYDLWLEWVNKQGGITIKNVKHPVQLLYEDDQSKADQSAILVQKLITEKKVNFLLGPYGSAATASDAVVAEKNQIPMVEGNGAAQSIFSRGYRYTFAVLSPADRYMKGVLDLASELTPKPTKIALLTANDNFSVEVAKAVEETAPQKGFTIVFNQKYPNGSTDLTGVLSQAKAKDPDMVINSGHLAEAIAMHKAAKDLKFNAKLFAYSVGPSTPDFIQALGKDADFVFTGSQWSPQVKYKPNFYLSVADYVAAYQKKFNTSEAPDYHVAESTAAALALQLAIQNAADKDPQKVRDALAQLNATTFFGDLRFDSRGVNVYKPMVVEQIQKGQHVTVFPRDVANGTAQYPTPAWDQR